MVNAYLRKDTDKSPEDTLEYPKDESLKEDAANETVLSGSLNIL